MDIIWSAGSLFVAGPDTHAHVVPGRAGDVSVGLRFAPGVAPTVLGVPADRLLDRREPLDAIWGRLDTERIGDALTSSRDLPAVLELVAVHRLRTTGPAPSYLPTIVAMLDRGASIEDVADAVGFSARQLQRHCTAAFGYGPKTLSRIRRMNRAIELAGRASSLAHAAAAAGYADQSHMSRDIKDIAGVTMTTLIG